MREKQLETSDDSKCSVCTKIHGTLEYFIDPHYCTNEVILHLYSSGWYLNIVLLCAVFSREGQGAEPGILGPDRKNC